MKAVLTLALVLAALPVSARRSDPVEESFKEVDVSIGKGEFSKARDKLDEILALLKIDDQRMVRYHERTGAAWLGEGRTAEARASFTAALKATQRLKVTGDSGAKAYTGMGLCLRRLNNDKYALRFFKKALTFNLDEGTKMFAEDQIREIEGRPPEPAR
ncbi:MAG: tetratricopeptide repeat protein [Elusimicrobia bacterium]|nr:tetratricopeptide repeat protein [Elusimicrobiota bacterium]